MAYIDCIVCRYSTLKHDFKFDVVCITRIGENLKVEPYCRKLAIPIQNQCSFRLMKAPFLQQRPIFIFPRLNLLRPCLTIANHLKVKKDQCLQLILKRCETGMYYQLFSLKVKIKSKWKLSWHFKPSETFRENY